MIKIVMLLRRRAGLTDAEFRDHYESVHAKIGEAQLRGHAVRYVRNYLSRAPQRDGAALTSAPFDAVTEICYPDEEAYAAARAKLMVEEVQRMIREDEARLFDTDDMHFYIVSEAESDLSV